MNFNVYIVTAILYFCRKSLKYDITEKNKETETQMGVFNPLKPSGIVDAK